MKYITTTRHQAVLSVDGEVFNILIEDDNGLALYINKDYIKDCDELPTSDELIEQINQYTQLEDMADQKGEYAPFGKVEEWLL